jgi:hypothetical protein
VSISMVLRFHDTYFLLRRRFFVAHDGKNATRIEKWGNPMRLCGVEVCSMTGLDGYPDGADSIPPGLGRQGRLHRPVAARSHEGVHCRIVSLPISTLSIDILASYTCFM